MNISQIGLKVQQKALNIWSNFKPYGANLI